jgi:dipeptidyl aminopeptidase/acylaminoacyl peptidase
VNARVPEHARAAVNGRIAFRRYLDVGKTTSAIFGVNPDGTQERQVTHPPHGADDRRPDWSPGGARIAFERKLPCPAGGAKDGLENTCDLVYTVNRDGKGLKQLVACGFDANAAFPGNCVGVDDPAWSPNGLQIAFQYNLVDHAYAGSEGVDGGIWVVAANGRGLRQVTQRTPGTAWDFGTCRLHRQQRRQRRASGDAVGARGGRSRRLVAGRPLAAVPRPARRRFLEPLQGAS